ncbi:MAG: biotin/lipoyl-binding protein, partial [Pseudomonadota bacterium]
LCSLVTILPDYLYRTRVQGKALGVDITFFSIWYELRWGITACAVLTISLITTIFYYHPSTTAVTSFFRTVTILPEAGGRVAEIKVRTGDLVEAGQPLFTLDASAQESAAETARRRIAEVEAALAVAEDQLAAAEGTVRQAEGSLDQARTELERKQTLAERSPDVVAGQELDRLINLVESRTGALRAASASRDAVQTEIDTLLPAQRASAEAALAEAEVALSKTVVRAGISGRVEQFQLREGDFVSPVLRPAGLLVPEDHLDGIFTAGFGQISAQVLEPGMVAEITCASMPFTVVPMVVVSKQDVLASGQFRPTDQLRDVQEVVRPGTVMVTMEPLFEGGTTGIPAGSTCIANAYTNFGDQLENGDLSTAQFVFYHVVDTVGVVHAAMLRIQAIMLPVRTLVLSGH